MIILHAGFYGNKLILWGETPLESAYAPPVKRGRKPKNSGFPHHPFDPGSDQLSVICGQLGLSGDPENLKPGLRVGWLPTVGGSPIASSALISEPHESESVPTIEGWEISVMPLDIPATLNLLCSCVGRNMLAPGLIIGTDIAYWVRAMQFAGSLAVRQKFLPDLVPEGSTFRACWNAVLSGADSDRFAQLSTDMPHVCRALTTGEATQPDVPSHIVLNRFINQLLDHLLRFPSAALPKVSQLQRGKITSPGVAGVHDQWLKSLHTPDGVMTGNPIELALLVRQIREWQRQIRITADAPFRLCFKLEEPEFKLNDDRKIDTRRARWRVAYLLQAVNDPSLLIPTQDVFNNHKKTIQAVLARYKFNAREYLWHTLGEAAGLSADIERSLKAAVPSGYDVDESGAVEFLTGTGLALSNADFVVLYPSWWTPQRGKRRLTVRANVPKTKLNATSGVLTMDCILAFNWEVAIGDEKLTVKELRQLAALKTPLVKVRGEWVQLDPEEIQSAIKLWEHKSERTTLRELMRMSLGLPVGDGKLQPEGVIAGGEVGKFFARLEGQSTLQELQTPAGFTGTLRPYQTRGFAWLNFLRQWGLGACLADDMGLGKTIQVLALIQFDRESGSQKPVLLVCPTSVIGNWRKEAERFTPALPVMVHHGGDRLKAKEFKQQAGQQGMVISSYALLHRDLKVLQQIDWGGVILDEAQNVKNPETKQARAARSLTADYRIAMTGTPVENHVGDMWSVMEFLNPGFLGSQAGFKREYLVPIQTGQDDGASERLKRITSPFILRRLKTDRSIISDLPDKIENKVYCPLTKEQASLYEAVAQDAIEALNDSEGISRKGLVLSTLMKLKQVCNHPAQFLGDNSRAADRSGKLERLREMLEELLEVGDRTLLFTQFKEMGDILQRHLQETFGEEVLFLHGSVTKKKRDKMVERFQSDSNAPHIFILSLKAGGTGLNLTNASHVFHFDRWWNPAVENQATDRAFRIGQKRNVMVHKFICSGTLEERIDDMIEHKKGVAEKVVGTGEGWLTELSTMALKELFTLRRDSSEA